MMAMAKNPEDRYQSAAELRDDLTRFSQGRPVAALPPSMGTPATRAVAGPPAYPPGYDLTYAQQDTRLVGQTGTVYAAGAAAEPQRSRAGWWAALFVVLLAVLGGVVYFIGQNANWWGTPATIPVPYLKGDPEAQAQSILKAKGFKHVHLKTARAVWYPTAKSSAPSRRRRGGATGPHDHAQCEHRRAHGPVPDRAGRASPAATAATTLNSANFKVKNVPQNNNSIFSGLVISTQPPGGQKYQQGDTVKVICSAGQQQTVVPDLQGLSTPVAGARLQAAHLRVGNSATVASATIKAGLVAYTAPAGGSAQPWGSVVTLYISGGQETVPVPSDLVGETLNRHKKSCNRRSCITASTPAHNQPFPGRVRDLHQPEAGRICQTELDGDALYRRVHGTDYDNNRRHPTTATAAPVTTTTAATTTRATTTTAERRRLRARSRRRRRR